MAPVPRPLAERFWSHVKKGEECWEWTGAQRGGGYGAIWVGNRKDGGHRPAHRVAWLLMRGPIPLGEMVCHRCDNRRCVRPDHLFLGNHQANMTDMAQKGRAASGLRHGRYTKPNRTAKGSRHGNSKLTQRKADAIRRRYIAGGVSTRQLAAEYKVDRRTIQNVLHWRIWR